MEGTKGFSGLPAPSTGASVCAKTGMARGAAVRRQGDALSQWKLDTRAILSQGNPDMERGTGYSGEQRCSCRDGKQVAEKGCSAAETMRDLWQTMACQQGAGSGNSGRRRTIQLPSPAATAARCLACSQGFRCRSQMRLVEQPVGSVLPQAAEFWQTTRFKAVVG